MDSARSLRRQDLAAIPNVLTHDDPHMVPSSSHSWRPRRRRQDPRLLQVPGQTHVIDMALTIDVGPADWHLDDVTRFGHIYHLDGLPPLRLDLHGLERAMLTLGEASGSTGRKVEGADGSPSTSDFNVVVPGAIVKDGPGRAELGATDSYTQWATVNHERGPRTPHLD